MNDWHALTVDPPSTALPRLYSFTVSPEGNAYTMRVTDGSRLWQERLKGTRIVRRCAELNPAVEAEAEDLIQEIDTSLLRGKHTYFKINDGDEDDVKLSATGKLEGYDFQWHFKLNVATSSEFFVAFTSELLSCTMQLLAENRRQHELLKAKDMEIAEYQASGASLERKTLKTEPYDARVLERVKHRAQESDSAMVRALCSDEFKLVQAHAKAEGQVQSTATGSPADDAKARRRRIRFKGVVKKEDLFYTKEEMEKGDDDEEEDEVKSPVKRPAPKKVAPPKNKTVAKKLKKL